MYAFDLFGFDTYLPKADELAGFSFVRSADSALNVDWDEAYEGETKMNITDEHAKEVLLSVLQDAMQREQYTVLSRLCNAYRNYAGVGTRYYNR